MKPTLAKRKGIETLRNILRIAFTTFLLTTFFIVGCGEEEDDKPESATVKIDIPSSTPLSSDDAVLLTVSTDFYKDTSTDKIIYNTKQELSITQDYEQTFSLDLEEPAFALILVNASAESIQLTLIYDDEEELSRTIEPNGLFSTSRQYTVGRKILN